MKIKQQYAALPYIVFRDHIEVLLITTRRSGRWIIPKGWPEDDLAPHKLAKLEAFEEAGLEGKIGKRSIGHFDYVKQLDDDSKITCNVEVFPLEVCAQYLDFPEKDQRELRWLKLKKAADLIEQKDLAKLVRNFDPDKDRSNKKSRKRARIKARLSASL